jgi:hypothetical protein
MSCVESYAVNGGENVAKNGGLSWSRLVVVGDDAIDNYHTTSFAIKNSQANH